MHKVLVKYGHAILGLLLIIQIVAWYMYWDNIYTAAGIK